MPKLHLKNDYSLKIIIVILRRSYWELQYLNCWPKIRMREVWIDSRSSSELCTWKYAVGTRHRTIVAWWNANVNFCVVLLWNRSKRYAVRDFCPGVLKNLESPPTLHNGTASTDCMKWSLLSFLLFFISNIKLHERNGRKKFLSYCFWWSL